MAVKKSVAVIGAGPKAAALAAKARTLRDCERGNVDILVFEQTEAAAHWNGGAGGFTDGRGSNVTPPEKDVGFPYASTYGTEVDYLMMRNYSWAAYLIWLKAYADWVDRGCPRPRHEAWGRYVQWVLGRASADVHFKRVVSVRRAADRPDRLVVTAKDRTKQIEYEVDGVVFTGPGPNYRIVDDAAGSPDDIDNAKNYWLREAEYAGIHAGKVAIIGGGETAASIAISILDNFPKLTIEIINRHGTLFSRGESFFENQLFSSNRGWAERSLDNRSEIMDRADRGLVSAKALARLSESSKRVAFRTARVKSFKKEADQIKIMFEDDQEAFYERVINAAGFDGWATLEILSDELRPDGAGRLTKDAQKRFMIDSNLRLPSDEPRANIHVPMVSAVSQGPGIPGLSSLGLLADMILDVYVPT